MDGEAYRAHVRSVMETAGWHWPEHLLLDPSKGPRFLSSADELLSELQLGTHMDEVLVLPDGVEKLGQSPPAQQHSRHARGREHTADNMALSLPHIIIWWPGVVGSISQQRQGWDFSS